MWLRVTGAPRSGRVLRRLLTIISAGSVMASMLFAGALPSIAVDFDTHSTVNTDAPDPVVVGTSVTITVTPKDENDADLGPGQTVYVSYTGSVDGPHTAVLANDETDGTYTATVADTVAQVDTINATVNGTAVQQAPTVTFTPGPADATTSTITAEAGPLTVDDPNADITVQLKDQYGNNLTSGGATVALADDADNADVSVVTDNSNGTYSATLSLSDHVPTVVGISGTLGEAAITDTESVDFLPGALASFAVVADDDPAIVAGTAFNVTATAKDQWGNIKTNYGGGATVGDSIATGLSTSPACTSCASGASAVSYGAFGTWTDGVATASVTAYAAETGRTVTVTDSPVDDDSNSFAVGVSTATNVDFADSAVTFNGQPITTKKGTNIYSVCDPSGSSVTPCLATPSSSPVAVLVRDAYGNPVAGKGVTLSAVTSGFTVTGTGTTGADGKVAFDPISATPSTKTGALVLKAALDDNATVNSNSQSFEIVDDLQACDGQSCSSSSTHTVGVLAPTSLSPTKGKPSSSITQRAYARISTDQDFFDITSDANVLLTTRWIAPTEVNNKCGTNSSLGDAVDIQAQGGLAETTPSTQMVLVLPAKTLQALGISSRGTPSFNVCLGALDLSGSADAWQQKKVTNKVVGLAPSSFDGTRYWGIPADCGFIGLASDDPCIGLRTKQASVAQAYLGLNSTDFAALGIKDSDLVIVIQKPYPWDAKGSIFEDELPCAAPRRTARSAAPPARAGPAEPKRSAACRTAADAPHRARRLVAFPRTARARAGHPAPAPPGRGRPGREPPRGLPRGRSWPRRASPPGPAPAREAASAPAAARRLPRPFAPSPMSPSPLAGHRPSGPPARRARRS